MEQVQDDVEIEPGEQTDAFVVSFSTGGGVERAGKKLIFKYKWHTVLISCN